MIAIVDYGVGNLFSLTSSLAYLGISAEVTGCAEKLRSADKIILPGVGAFGDAYAKLAATGLDEVIKEEVANGKPLLGVCLGMQLLFEQSTEYGVHKGLGLIKGEVVSLAEAVDGLKVPQMGWNSLNLLKNDPILKYNKEGDYVYYVHSYYAPVGGYTLASSEYGVNVSGVVANGKVYGTQFHPEKSGAVGLNLLKAFEEIR